MVLEDDLFQVYCLPGNGGTKLMRGKVENVPGIEKLEEIVKFAQDTSIDLVCVGPEQPLVDGLCDLMKTQVHYNLFLLSDCMWSEYPVCWTSSKCSEIRIIESLVQRFYAKKQYSDCTFL
jgi:hypothetical protein